MLRRTSWFCSELRADWRFTGVDRGCMRLSDHVGGMEAGWKSSNRREGEEGGRACVGRKDAGCGNQELLWW